MSTVIKCNKCQKSRDESTEHIEFLQKYKNCPECRSKIAQMKKQQRKNKSEKAQTTHKSFNTYLKRIEELNSSHSFIRNLKFYNDIENAPIITLKDLDENQNERLAEVKTFLKDTIISKIEIVLDTTFAIRSSNFKNNKKLYISLICCQDHNGLAKSKSKGLRGFNNKKRIYDCKSLLILNYSPVKCDLTIEFTHQSHTDLIKIPEVEKSGTTEKKVSKFDPVKDESFQEQRFDPVPNSIPLNHLQVTDQVSLLSSAEFQHNLQVQLHHQRQLQVQQLNHQRQQQHQYRIYQQQQHRQLQQAHQQAQVQQFQQAQHQAQQQAQQQAQRQAQIQQVLQQQQVQVQGQARALQHPIHSLSGSNSSAISDHLKSLQEHHQQQEIKSFEEANNALMAQIQNATDLQSIDDHLAMPTEITSDQIDNALLNSGITTQR